MNADDLYAGRLDLMTEDDKEEWYHEPSSETIPTLTQNLKDWLILTHHPIPDSHDKEEFLLRKPALGATTELLIEAKQHYLLLPPVQQRIMFKCIRHKMLRQLISCSGASTMEEHLDILRKEMESGVPSPVPDWYTFSRRKMGPRAFGFYECENRECRNTETVEKQFERCAKCKLAYYCCRECQGMCNMISHLLFYVYLKTCITYSIFLTFWLKKNVIKRRS